MTLEQIIALIEADFPIERRWQWLVRRNDDGYLANLMQLNENGTVSFDCPRFPSTARTPHEALHNSYLLALYSGAE